MSDPDYYAAMRVADLPEPYVPSNRAKCERCREDVWVSKVGWAASPLPILCVQCVSLLVEDS